ncbi:MAG: dephospho-CoA kinase [Paludibacter sp.]|nr:dephospho-CoA kinase [Paludibacter sp.]
MKKPIVIGITGGIGSGKTTVAEILRANGFDVYNSDVEAKRLQNENTNIRKKITELFGQEIYKNVGLDRRELATLVFGNPILLDKLNAIVHPVVIEDFMNWKQNHLNKKYVFLESAVLFESGFNLFTDKIMLITANENIRIKRVMERDGFTEEQVRMRMNNQLSDEQRMEFVDAVINTDMGPPTIIELKKIISDFSCKKYSIKKLYI